MTNRYDGFEVEIGCGKGKFLVARAQENKQIFFIGLDKAKKWMKRGASRAQKRKLENIKFIKGDVWRILEILPLESVSVFHIYFPDPWPKRRHHPRRILTADLLHRLHRHLKSFGLIEIATDDLDYFRHIKKVIEGMNGTWKRVREAQNERLFPSSVATNYERKFQAEGKNLNYLELQK